MDVGVLKNGRSAEIVSVMKYNIIRNVKAFGTDGEVIQIAWHACLLALLTTYKADSGR